MLTLLHWITQRKKNFTLLYLDLIIAVSVAMIAYYVIQVWPW
jgi:hypothetical protein